MFYRLGKNFEKPQKGVQPPFPPPPNFYVRDLKTKKTIGDRTFMIVAPMLWHSMPLSIRPAATTDTLKRSIKTIINLLSFACFIIIIVTFNRTFILL